MHSVPGVNEKTRCQSSQLSLRQLHMFLPITVQPKTARQLNLERK